MNTVHKAGFVNIFGPPNAGKSTLLNALLGEHLVIVSNKVQTTRHRILGIMTEPEYQIVFSDTPGIIAPKYKLHQKMMGQVMSALDDTDVALLMVDINDDPQQFKELLAPYKIKGKTILLLNKIDTVANAEELDTKRKNFAELIAADEIMMISADTKANIDQIIPKILEYLPENPPFYPDDSISDRPMRFFVSELIREKIYSLYEKEIPYHTAVLVQSYEELPHVTKIRADIVVTRETQKMILLGTKGALIKKLGTLARQDIEEFIGGKVFLELFVKVRPKWRDNETYLREYGY